MEVRQVVPRDAIPSVDDPSFGETYDGDPDDRVVVVGSDPPRAYPVPILDYHEVVNDVVPAGTGTESPDTGTGGTDTDAIPAGTGTDPVAITWCPLCGSGVVYDRRLDGRTLTFGVSGKLADDDLVMYDRETESEWKQSSGECIAGAFADRRLSVRPSTVTTWRRFAAAHPGGMVLEPPGGASEAASDGDDPAPIDYGTDPYADYRAGDGFGLDAHRGGEGRTWDRTDLSPKAVVLGLEGDGEAVGVPAERVRAAGGVVTTTVGDRDVVVFATADGIHAYEDPGIDFEPTDDPSTVTGDGARWSATTGEAEDGRSLDRVPGRRLFAFAWQDDHGPDAFLGPSSWS